MITRNDEILVEFKERPDLITKVICVAYSRQVTLSEAVVALLDKQFEGWVGFEDAMEAHGIEEVHGV